MRAFISLFLSLLFIRVCTYAQPAYLLNKPYSEKYTYFDSLWRATELDAEHLKNLDMLSAWAHGQGDNELSEEYTLLKYRVQAIAGNKYLKETELQELILKARKQKYNYLEARAVQLMGNIYNTSLKKYAHAVEYYLMAYKIYSKFTSREFPDKPVFLFEFGGAYSSYGDFDNAIKYFREALAASINDKLISNTTYNSLGVCYRKMKKYDSAEWFFNKIYLVAQERNDSAWVGIAAGNIGIIYFLQNRYDEAIPLLEKDIELSIATNQIQNAAGSMEYLSSIYYLRKDYDAAEKLLLRALSISQSRPFWPYYPLAERLYGSLYKVYAAKKDMLHAYLYADSTIKAKDSVFVLYNALSLSKVVEKAEMAEQKLETEQIEGQKKMQLLVRNSLIAGIFLVTIIGILFINRQKLNQKRLEIEKKNAEQELGSAAIQLQNFKESVQEKNNLIEHITTELERIKQRPDQQTDEDVLTQLGQAIILTDEQWEDFRLLFEKVHKNFFVNLKKKIPDLTQAETRLLTLTKLKLSSKEMAAMMGISPNTIRIYRHRLRRKLELDKEEMIEELVENI